MVQPAMKRLPEEGKTRNVLLWTLQILAAAAFLAAGAGKFAGSQQVVEVFDKLGMGQWFRYLTGALEVAGGVMLLIPRFVFYGAALLAVVMVGAAISHLTALGGSPAAALVLLVVTATIAYLRRP